MRKKSESRKRNSSMSSPNEPRRSRRRRQQEPEQVSEPSSEIVASEHYELPQEPEEYLEEHLEEHEEVHHPHYPDLPDDDEEMEVEHFDDEMEYEEPIMDHVQNRPIQSTGHYRTLLCSLFWDGNSEDTVAPELPRQASMMMALQELSETLSIATEDMFAGYHGMYGGGRRRMTGFDVGEFVRALLKVVQGPPTTSGNLEEKLEKAGIARDFPLEFLDPVTLASLGLNQDEQVNPDLAVLALRCLSNLVEAFPPASHIIVTNQGVPILVEKLKQVEFIDLAESVLSLLEKLSAEFGGTLLRNGAVSATLAFIDFFSNNTQRVACGIVASSLRGLNQISQEDAERYLKESDAVQTLCRLLRYGDEKLVDSSIKALQRIVEWMVRGDRNLTEKLIVDSVFDDLIDLLQPSSPLPPAMYTTLMKVVQPMVKSSPKYAHRLLDKTLMNVIAYVLMGTESNVITAVHKASSMDQVTEIVNLIVDIVPNLPRRDVWLVEQEGVREGGYKQDMVKLFDKEGKQRFIQNTTKLIPMLLELHGATVQAPLRRRCMEALARWLYLSGQLDKNGVEQVVRDNLHILGSSLTTLLQGVQGFDKLSPQDVSRRADSITAAFSSLQIIAFILSSAPSVGQSLAREGVLLEVENCRLVLNKIQVPTSASRSDHGDRLIERLAMLDNGMFDNLLNRHAFCQTLTGDRVTIQQLLTQGQKLAEKILEKKQDLGSTTQDLKLLLKGLRGPDGQVQQVKTLYEIAKTLVTQDLTAFEVMESGLIDSLIKYLDVFGQVKLWRVKAFTHVFLNGPWPIPQGLQVRPNTPGKSFASSHTHHDDLYVPDAFKVLIDRLQTLLSKSETWEVLSAFGPNDYGGINPVAQMARQMRLRLVSPTGKVNMSIGVHAIATFTNLEDYLKSRYGEALFTQIDVDEDSDDDVMIEDGQMDNPLVDLESVLRGAIERAAQGSSSPVAGSSTSTGNNSEKRRARRGKVSRGKSKSPSKSYAQASGFDLEFEIGDLQTEEFVPISKNSTVFGACWKYNQSRQGGSVWSQQFAIRFKKSQGQPLQDEPIVDDVETHLPYSTQLVCGVDKETVHGKIMYLLRALYGINTHWNTVYMTENFSSSSQHDVPEPLGNPLDEEVMMEESEALVTSPSESVPPRNDEVHHPGQIVTLPTNNFVNAKIAAKLNRQLDEPLIVASKVLPSWCDAIARHFGFLVNFETRWLWVQSTSFGYARSMQRWQQDKRNSMDSLASGRMLRQKLRITRNKMIDSMIKIMDQFGSGKAMLEVEFAGEVGTGLGPTLEFYNLTCQELRKHKMWRRGLELFPSPKVDHKILNLFGVTGTFCAKALLDGRIIDLPLNSVFIKSILHGDLPRQISKKVQEGDLAMGFFYLKFVDGDLCKSLLHLVKYLNQDKVDGMDVQDLALDFTLPGYEDLELVEGGKDMIVTRANLKDYLIRVLDKTIGMGIVDQVDAFRKGFDKVWPIQDLAGFTVDEVAVLMAGEGDEDWSVETLQETVKADHGYTMTSLTVKNLLEIMSSFTLEERRDFLTFVTGSPRLPLGGFKNLTPPLTVVCKKGGDGDYLPSVMTCVNYLKLPDYSDKEMLKAKLGVAMNEGKGCFHLS